MLFASMVSVCYMRRNVQNMMHAQRLALLQWLVHVVVIASS